MSSVPPLRISKTPSSSPAKMAVGGRPLAEITDTSQRRNSPSYNQATKKMIVSDSSPYGENQPVAKSSPQFPSWSPRSPLSPRDTMAHSRFDSNSPERSPSPSISSPLRKSSIEKLQKASRVKNSNIFAMENKVAYDPESVPIVERPTANRPISQQMANNSFTQFDNLHKENSSPARSPGGHGHKRTDSQNNIQSPSRSPMRSNLSQTSPDRQGSPSPSKSALSRVSKYSGQQPHVFDASRGTWSEDDRSATPRGLHRHQKSVTFHKEPPVVQEYEQPTPEPSITNGSERESSYDSDDFYDQENSFDRASSAEAHEDDSFDADLENADKTPVVLPEDWSHMSPSGARRDLANNEDDVFDSGDHNGLNIPRRSGSAMSDGSESRPLPPLPGFMSESGGALGTAADRAAHYQRNLPSPPKRAPLSKEDILKMTTESSLTLQDRLQLMGGSEQKESEAKSPEAVPGEEELYITDLDTGEKSQIEYEDQAEENAPADEVADSQSPPRISRESILAKVRKERYAFEADDETELSGIAENDDTGRPDITELAKMHPDQAVPSRENSRENSETNMARHSPFAREETQEPEIKDEPADDEQFDMSAIPEARPTRSPSRMDDYKRQGSVLRHDMRSESADDDYSMSRFSASAEPEGESTQLHSELPPNDEGKESLHDAMQLLTVKDYSQTAAPKEAPQSTSDFNGLPTYLSTGGYDFGMSDFITPPTERVNRSKEFQAQAPVLQPPVDFMSRGFSEPPATEDVSPPESPSSVIRHDSGDVSSLHESEMDMQEPELPEVPESTATIKTNGKLKARPSGTPADFEAMAEQRRLVSNEHPVPSIPQQWRGTEPYLPREESGSYYSSEDDVNQANEHEEASGENKHKHSRTMTIDLDIPTSARDNDLGLEADFDRVIEGQKKGYLTRQNTKIVVASNRDISNDSGENARPRLATDSLPSAMDRSNSRSNNGARKPSGEQFLKTEPWNGRRKSLRNSSAYRQSLMREPAPPLPGQESALGVVNEDAASRYSGVDQVEDDGERGRLFVKVVGVKNLDMRMPKNERVDFQLTLDNGLHCVTTTSLELGQSAPIGQEFELVVLDDLEFQLTLSTKLTPPSRPRSQASTSPIKSKSQKGGLSRFLQSPKKRAEKERLEREAVEAEERRAQDEWRKRRAVNPTGWDLMHDLVNGADGSFARAYVNLKAHEKQCFGRKATIDVPCYNEWALEKDTQILNSVRSKRGTNNGPIRRPPYVIGQMEVQLLYVPKPKGATDEDMPRSMGNAVREMNKAVEPASETHEGHLSQQGGDCKHWRRRFFRLSGTKLTAYHEHTHQKRAVINLSKAARLVDDKTMLVADPSSKEVGGKDRRKSAFAEEDEGYQYVEEGFRIRFSNGETIDFYAESTKEKDKWMVALSKCIGKKEEAKKKATWTDMVFAHEATNGRHDDAVLPRGGTDVKDFTRQQATAHQHQHQPAPLLPTAPQPPSASLSHRPQTSVASRAPSIPPKAPARNGAPGPAPTGRPSTPPMAERRSHRTRDAVRSMIF